MHFFFKCILLGYICFFFLYEHWGVSKSLYGHFRHKLDQDFIYMLHWPLLLFHNPFFVSKPHQHCRGQWGHSSISMTRCKQVIIGDTTRPEVYMHASVSTRSLLFILPPTISVNPEVLIFFEWIVHYIWPWPSCCNIKQLAILMTHRRQENSYLACILQINSFKYNRNQLPCDLNL